MDPIRPISNPAESIPPVVAASRIDRVTRRQRDPQEPEDGEHEAEDQDEETPDDGHPHIDVSA